MKPYSQTTVCFYDRSGLNEQVINERRPPEYLYICHQQIKWLYYYRTNKTYTVSSLGRRLLTVSAFWSSPRRPAPPIPSALLLFVVDDPLLLLLKATFSSEGADVNPTGFGELSLASFEGLMGPARLP